MDIRQAVKELRDRYLEEGKWDAASDLDNILLVRSPARSGARSDSNKEGDE